MTEGRDNEPGEPSPEALLGALAWSPADVRLRERAARALERAGRPAQAVQVLAQGLINVAAHEASGLPCLCANCLVPGETRVEASGMVFHREFAVARWRVLYFWLPEELLGRRVQARHSVAGSLGARLAQRQLDRRRPGRRSE